MANIIAVIPALILSVRSIPITVIANSDAATGEIKSMSNELLTDSMSSGFE